MPLSMISSIQQRLLRSYDDFLAAVISGSTTLETFCGDWLRLHSDIVVMFTSGRLDVATMSLAQTTYSRLAIYASTFHQLSADREQLTEKLMDEAQSMLSRMSISDDPPAVCFNIEDSRHLRPHMPDICTSSFEEVALSWLMVNLNNPYPSDSVRLHLAQCYGIPLSAVSQWFKTTRRKIGWTSLCRGHFRGSRRRIIDDATIAFTGKHDQPLAAQFESIQDNVYRMFCERDQSELNDSAEVIAQALVKPIGHNERSSQKSPCRDYSHHGVNGHDQGSGARNPECDRVWSPSNCKSDEPGKLKRKRGICDDSRRVAFRRRLSEPQVGSSVLESHQNSSPYMTQDLELHSYYGYLTGTPDERGSYEDSGSPESMAYFRVGEKRSHHSAALTDASVSVGLTDLDDDVHGSLRANSKQIPLSSVHASRPTGLSTGLERRLDDAHDDGLIVEAETHQVVGKQQDTNSTSSWALPMLSMTQAHVDEDLGPTSLLDVENFYDWCSLGIYSQNCSSQPTDSSQLFDFKNDWEATHPPSADVTTLPSMTPTTGLQDFLQTILGSDCDSILSTVSASSNFYSELGALAYTWSSSCRSPSPILHDTPVTATEQAMLNPASRLGELDVSPACPPAPDAEIRTSDHDQSLVIDKFLPSQCAAHPPSLYAPIINAHDHHHEGSLWQVS
ncbi:A mating type protein [Gelatoporia subvermispora B]|uniref:A mating type protein n=1 Tax=Ceriporiopsis subvermispora (strain B) TaxID=914234 RepID=M2RV52_CERS8|nr:A mating type protein [Gelatoporia subvermispora B]